MAKKKKKNNRSEDPTPAPVHKITPEQQAQMYRLMGFLAGLFSKSLLKAGGCEVDYRINGEEISNIEQLHGLDITERINLAVKEERYEDAANLKKLLERKTKALNGPNQNEDIR